MSNTIVGVFGSHQQAEDALQALRSDLSVKDVAIIMKNEEIGGSSSGQAPLGMSIGPGTGMGMGMGMGMGSGTGMNAPANMVSGLTHDVVQLGESAGQLAGRTAALTAGAAFTLPALVLGSAIQSLLGPTAAPGSFASGASGGMMSQGGGMMNQGGGSEMSSRPGTEQVVITVQAEEPIPQAADILRLHGAREVSSYIS